MVEPEVIGWGVTIVIELGWVTRVLVLSLYEARREYKKRVHLISTIRNIVIKRMAPAMIMHELIKLYILKTS